MSIDDEKMKVIAVYDEEKDDFFIIEDTNIDAENRTYMIIDEFEQKTTLSFPKSAGLIQKRSIERRVASYAKAGYPIGDQGLRIGAKFELEKIVTEDKLPDTLLTHGHTFGKKKLVRDDIPDYVEPEETYEVESGSAATKFESESPQVTIESPASTPEPTPQPTYEPTPEPTPEPIAPTPTLTPTPVKTRPTSSSLSLDVTGNVSDVEPSDNALFALGQFVDQFSREGKVVVVYCGADKKYKIIRLKDLKTGSEIDTSYELDGLDLYQV
ncbi:MAG: hypothetical protein ACXAC7_24020 [Candidatus Hodarchaeales archaeon]|jgi:hypothetical protein